MLKTINIIFFTLIFYSIGFGQENHSDSLRLANHNLDIQILDRLKKLDYEGADFVILRVKDTVYSYLNECVFMVSEDSCTTRFKMVINNDMTISHIVISNILYTDSTCSKLLLDIASDMNEFGNFFSTFLQPHLQFNRSPFMFYWKVNGKYSIEYFDQEFVSSFHTGIFYDTVCAYFYGNCKQ